ncbi:CDP-glycerol glycerophosphotransferase family protein [Mammaliicoccus sciuri]|uniref:CDP-glycerol glycerophosphotransferase family protein n=1 Tax=Mammaliicoccus sciuri TaxID=1296 RepID=UPI002175349E|nr:CDP-glycerol glycerophosphotransferase family protein [Mammaliicoccus sciuri]
MGFGPVLNETQDILKEIIKIKNKNYKISSFYLNRVNNFFEYKDKNNCFRLIYFV